VDGESLATVEKEMAQEGGFASAEEAGHHRDR
jgi:hypothetical protein